MGKWMDRVKTTKQAPETESQASQEIQPSVPAPELKPVKHIVDVWEPTHDLPGRLLPEDKTFLLGYAAGACLDTPSLAQLVAAYCQIWKQAPGRQGRYTANTWLRTGQWRPTT